MLPALKAFNAQIIMETDRRLIPLLHRSYPEISFIPEMETAGIMKLFPAIQSQISSGDLGGIFRRERKDFPAQNTYFAADTNNTERIRSKNHLEPDARIIGLSWKSRNLQFGADKSLALIDFLPVVDQFRDVVFVSLQYGDVSQEVKDFEAATGRRIRLLQGVDLFASMEDLASAISLCTEVVTCSNVTAHMACALGKDTKVLLPEGVGRIWYWGADGESTPWYPTARLFRQHATGDWNGVIADVKQALTTLTT